jgi:demethylsterigmatocystin 6-O-methyltransferase
MASQRTSQKSWVTESTLFPIKEFTLQSENHDSEAVLMVDVGGGAGHQCIALRQAHGNLKGRVVLQDLPGTIAMIDQSALKQLNIEAQAHDFMTAQPIKGAKVYYMRNILHDWPDATCLTILRQLRAAMTQGSAIIIDETVVRSSESTWKQVNYDFVMMAALGGLERTKDQWVALLSEVNLELREVTCYDNETGDSILIAGPAA